MSKADQVFINMCRDILEHGDSSEGQDVRAVWSDGMPAHTIKRFGVVNRYDLSEEFPALTLRPVPFGICVDELLWIWQRKSNRIRDLASRIWDSWADADGTIGKAYGYQLGVKYDFGKGRVMDQVDNVLWQLKHTPYSRRIMTNLYNFADLAEMGLEPCAYSMTFNVTEAPGGNSIGGKSRGRLNAILNQRSQDVLAANAWNVCQYAVLVHMIAQVSGLDAGEFVHVIADAHVYDRHIPIIEALIERPPHPAPRLWIDDSVTDFYDFTSECIKLEGYETGAQIKGIPIAI
ncbi:MAG: thymidylate synthase [Clostridiales Family XIII bacterium]|jgi:thymidylate synthase|nr:thymidylate synthase [Clostridiales Family XIII bacterium]